MLIARGPSLSTLSSQSVASLKNKPPQQAIWQKGLVARFFTVTDMAVCGVWVTGHRLLYERRPSYQRMTMTMCAEVLLRFIARKHAPFLLK
tara:strand:- start:824 stop:1096 length:273 start_codon:yes stop_codon:yes gene_type:complete